MADDFYPSLSGSSVSLSYRGLLHFPKGIDNSLAKQVVYDGVGVPTALTLGGGSMGASLSGNLDVAGDINVDSNVTIKGSLSVGTNIRSVSAVAFNDLTVLSSGSDVSLRASKGVESSFFRIRRTSGNYELFFGNPDNLTTPNLFTVKVNGDSTNNFYIKSDYSALDTLAPFWINRSTDEVNIKTLKTDNIINTISVSGKNAYRHTIQPGTVTMYASSAVPDGYLKCDGSIYIINDYTDLYSVIGQQHKLASFDTGTQFQVPLISDISSSMIYIIKW
jgi:hypothetical protein